MIAWLYSNENFTLPPKEWMRWERMVVARRKLTGGKTPEVVAADLGFATPNNFRREFLEVYRVPPLRFQQESWGEGEETRNSELGKRNSKCNDE